MRGKYPRTSFPIIPEELVPKWPDVELMKKREEADQMRQLLDTAEGIEYKRCLRVDSRYTGGDYGKPWDNRGVAKSLADMPS